MELRGRVGLVTGAARRVGQAIALGLARRGAGVAISYRSSRQAAQETVHQLRAFGVRAEAIRADVARAADAKRLIEQVVARFGRLDVLVNNASIFERTPFDRLTERDWDRHLDANLKGPFLCALYAGRYMQRRRQGKIINLAGGGAAFPWPRFSAYRASKAAVVRFTETLAAEVKDHHIQVNVMAPGANDTEMFRKAAEAEPRLLADLPGDTLKPARLACFLASEASDHITGRFIHVDQNWDEWTESDLAGDRFTLRRV